MKRYKTYRECDGRTVSGENLCCSNVSRIDLPLVKNDTGAHKVMVFELFFNFNFVHRHRQSQKWREKRIMSAHGSTMVSFCIICYLAVWMYTPSASRTYLECRGLSNRQLPVLSGFWDKCQVSNLITLQFYLKFSWASVLPCGEIGIKNLRKC